MKKHLLFTPLILASFFCGAQKKDTTEKTFELGIGVGAQALLTDQEAGKVFSVGLSLQAENHFTSQFSGFISAGYNLLFSTEGGGTAGFIPIQAGPRIYFDKQIFVGVGVGYGILTGGGDTESAFNYFPHFGINSQENQVILGYNVLSKNGVSSGFLDLKIVFKL
jgi:hypothetical protein